MNIKGRWVNLTGEHFQKELTLVRNISAPLQSEVVRFLSWWSSELADLLPGAAPRGSRGSDSRYIVSIESSGLCLLDSHSEQSRDPGSRLVAAASQQEVLLRLADLARSRAGAVIGIRVPFSACFTRDVELPVTASANFRQLLAVDFERATPFKVRDVYLAHFVETRPAAPGKVWVRQLVVKRGVVDGLKSEIEALGLEVGYLDCWDANAAAALPINLLDRDGAGPSSGRSRWSMSWLLGGFALALAIAGALLLNDKYETAVQELQIQSSRQKVRSQAVREALSRSRASYSEIANFDRLKNDNVSKLTIIEELTRLLPDTAWVTDLRIDGATVELSGFAKSAAALIPIIERSTLFVDAMPTAPLTFDQREDKDRFSLRARIRKVAAATNDARAEPNR
jgi:general secretion pathway protein L